MRGTILRNTDRGDGLIAAEGKQFTFNLENHWRGERAPGVNDAVVLGFAASGQLESVQPVDTAQVAKEKARWAIDQGQRLLNVSGNRGGDLARQLTARVGVPDIVATAVLLVGSTLFSTLDLKVMGSAAASLSLYSVLGLAVDGPQALMAYGGQHGGAGFFGFLIWALAVFGPLLASLSRRAKAGLAYFLPLGLWLFLGIAVWRVVSAMSSAMDAMRGFVGNDAALKRMMPDLGAAFWQSFGMGLGFYLTLAATAWFVLRGVTALRNRNA